LTPAPLRDNPSGGAQRIARPCGGRGPRSNLPPTGLLV
jgi:hypothetical protein